MPAALGATFLGAAWLRYRQFFFFVVVLVFIVVFVFVTVFLLGHVIFFLLFGDGLLSGWLGLGGLVFLSGFQVGDFICTGLRRAFEDLGI